LSSITEPIDFMFIFTAPLLYLIHSVIAGLFMALLKVFDVIALWNGNLLSSILTNIANADKTNRMWLMWVLGLIQIVVYFVVFTILIKKLNYHTPGREGEPLPAGAVPDEPAPQPETVSAAASAGAAPAAAAPDAPADSEAMSIINGLGGKGNILALENCITRLRVSLKDPSLLNEALINKTQNSGIVKKGSDVQIIYGLRVADVKRDVEEQLEKL
ncbi:MAG: PTS transporter subunit EIIB, partial [Gemmiger sp.]